MTAAEFADRLSARRNGTGWMARCPAHDDQHASLSIAEGDDGRVLLYCHVGCAAEQIVSALGLAMADLFDRHNGHQGQGGSSPSRLAFEHSNGPPGLTLAEYAAAKRLPVDFLKTLDLSEMSYFGRKAVRMPYIDGSGETRGVRVRLALDKGDGADNRFRWTKGSKLIPYGLTLLDRARAAGYVALAEGESDVQTLTYHGEPVLGVPGANTWREAWADWLDGIPTIYVIDEADKGAETLLATLSQSRIRDRVHVVRLEVAKDPSALHVADPDRFQAAWKAALASAVPLAELSRQEAQTDAASYAATAATLMADPRLLERAGVAMQARGYAGDLRPPKLVYVALTSRLLERPMNVAVVSPSAAGKNRAVEAALELVPPEAVHVEGAGSARALIYSDEDYQHRVVVVEEADSIPEDGPAASAIRELAASNRMIYDVVEKNDAGRFETRHIEKPGPTSLITTSTRSLGTQMGTRVLEVAISDAPEQTRAVMLAHARAVLPSTVPAIDVEPFVALQRWLALAGERRVIVPFAETLAELVPPSAVRMRRDFRQLLTCTQAIALLYQAQRQRTPEGWIVATLEDYGHGRELLEPVFDMLAAEGVTKAIRQTVQAVEPGEELTEAALAERLSLSKSTVSWRVRRAIEGGWLVNRQTVKGAPARLARGTPLPEERSALPTVEEVRRVFECSNANREGEEPPSLSLEDVEKMLRAELDE